MNNPMGVLALMGFTCVVTGVWATWVGYRPQQRSRPRRRRSRSSSRTRLGDVSRHVLPRSRNRAQERLRRVTGCLTVSELRERCNELPPPIAIPALPKSTTALVPRERGPYAGKAEAPDPAVRSAFPRPPIVSVQAGYRTVLSGVLIPAAA
ncbi:hypothetical protein [Actinoalloteichus hymeniacidonis]|uniref:hypothetical protein n=1 Tax=Actinoalloteichus hymeniacidonis TaxID=340345 RepID=UPI0008539CAA|nr:hypothetical protein [Actinoalloteichus hymeniacidonis]MBB5910882.1 hypothetical protein [Actinoalloteichus hymeniacidonis]